MKKIPKIETMRSDIERAKKRLMSKPIVENFGQDEVRRIADKYSDLQLDYYSDYSRLITNFSDWCMNYTGVKSSVSEDPEVIEWQQAESPSTSSEVLRKLADSDKERIRVSVARNPNTPHDVLERLSKDEGYRVRVGVARNSSVPVSILDELVEDDDQRVRFAVMDNPRYSEEDIVQGEVITTSRNLKPFIVTWGYDAGGPESGPKWRKGEEIQYGTSEEDACRRWEEDNHSWCNSPYSGYEGCWAKETTEEIAQEMNRKMHEEQEMLEEEVRRMFPDVYDEDITSATKSSAVKLPKEYAKYYNVYPIDEAYIEETQEVLDDYELEYLGDAACKDKYLDAFSDNGIEYGTIARDEDGNIKVYLLAGGRVYDILDEVNIALEREW